MSKETFTFDGFEPANTTPVPDVLFDKLLPELSESELKILLYIIRRTAGFKKPTDAISLSQFQGGITKKDGEILDRGCGIKDRTTIIKGLASLEKKGCIHIDKSDSAQGDKATSVYRVRFRAQEVVGKPDYPVHLGSGQTRLPLVGKPDYGSGQNALPVVGNSDPQETVIQLNSLQETDRQERENASAIAPTRAPAVFSEQESETRTNDGTDATIRAPEPVRDSVALGDVATLREAGRRRDGQLSDEQTSPALSNDGAARTSPSEPRASGGRTPTKRAPKPVETPPDEQLSAEEHAFYLEYCSLFHVAIPLNRAIIKATKQLLQPVSVWADILHLTHAQTLDNIQKWVYENDKKGYYKGRGVKLYDIAREFEGWQSEQEREHAGKAKPSNGLPPQMTREQRKAMPVW